MIAVSRRAACSRVSLSFGFVTLLYAFGVDLPELEWGKSEARLDPAVVERMGLERAKRLGEVCARGGGKDSSPRIGTPEPFRDLLISMARSAYQARKAA